MKGFDRFNSLKVAIAQGNKEFAMMLADFHLVKGTITQEEYEEINALAYPTAEVTADDTAE
jgi:hypothetical protein